MIDMVRFGHVILSCKEPIAPRIRLVGSVYVILRIHRVSVSVISPSPFCRANLKQFCVHYQGCYFFNTLKSDIRNACSVSQFKSFLKKKKSTFTSLIPCFLSLLLLFFASAGVWYLLLLSQRPHYVTVVYFG